ncbi:MAG: hypothetical protein WB443_10690, partial [Nitrososphaeraceae archaeon]
QVSEASKLFYFVRYPEGISTLAAEQTSSTFGHVVSCHLRFNRDASISVQWTSSIYDKKKIYKRQQFQGKDIS